MALPLFIDDDPDTTLASLRSRARRLQINAGLDLLIIDYLQLIEVSDRAAGESQTQHTSYISKNLKHLARELRCPVLVLSQLNRECEKRNPPIPGLSDLRDAGSIEQDADTKVWRLTMGGPRKPPSSGVIGSGHRSNSRLANLLCAFLSQDTTSCWPTVESS